MWFRVSFFPNKPDLVAVVTIDGSIYWKCENVGEFLGYSNTNRFAIRYGTNDLNKLVPKYARTCKQIPVFSFEKMTETMSKVKFSFKNVDKLSFLWSEGNIEITDTVSKLIQNASPRIIFTDNKNAIKITDWVKSYVEECLRNFSRIQTMEDIDMKKIKPNPPKEVKNTCTEEECQQVLPQTKSENVSYGQDEDLMDFSPCVKSESDPLPISNPIFQIAYDGMIIPEEIHLNINGEIYTYIKTFTHLIEG